MKGLVVSKCAALKQNAKNRIMETLVRVSVKLFGMYQHPIKYRMGNPELILIV